MGTKVLAEEAICFTGGALTPEQMSGVSMPGYPFFGLSAGDNPWPAPYFTGLAYGQGGYDRVTQLKNTYIDVEQTVTRERLLAANQIRVLQECLARERASFMAFETKTKQEGSVTATKEAAAAALQKQLETKIQEQKDGLEKIHGEKMGVEDNLLRVQGLLDNEKKLHDTCKHDLDQERLNHAHNKKSLEGELAQEKAHLEEMRCDNDNLRKDKEVERAAGIERESQLKVGLGDVAEQARREADDALNKLKLLEIEKAEKERVMKKEIDDTTAARIESDAKACSARDLFEGEIEVLKFQVEGEQAKVKGLKAIAGESEAGHEKKCRMIEDALGAERNKSFEVKTKLDGEKSQFGRDLIRFQELLATERARTAELEDKIDHDRMKHGHELESSRQDLTLEKKKALNAENRDSKDLALAIKEQHNLNLLFEKEKNKKSDLERMMDIERKNFDKIKIELNERMESHRNRNTDVEDELRREIATLQRLIQTLKEQVQFEKTRREVHDVNFASKTSTVKLERQMGK